MKLKPKGHPIQPSIEQVIAKTTEFLNKYEIDKIFVVTEDMKIYQRLEDSFKGKVFSSDNKFVGNYNGQNYLASSFNDDPYERGLAYLVRLMLLCNCDYLISSLTNGSLFTIGMKPDEYKAEYIFDLGKYS